MVLLGGFLIAAAPRVGAQLPQAFEGFASEPEPGLSYGQVADFSLPKTILFSAGPEHIIADAEEWARRGVQAFFLDFVAREWSSDIWARDGKPWTIGESDETFQKAKRANEICRKIGAETFLKIAFDHTFEWFNDIAWQRIYNNFRQFAIFARETGCTGIAIDIEYVGEQYAFDWPGYDYDGYTRADLVAKVRERMTRVIQILYEEFPDMVFLTFPEEGFSLGTVIQAAWLEEAARRNAPGGFVYCVERTYRRPNIRFVFGHAWGCNRLFREVLSDRAWRYWQQKGSIAAGIWPFGRDYSPTHEPGLTVEAFRQGYAANLMTSRRYNWIYSHNSREQLLGRKLDEYKGEADLRAYLEIIRRREIVTNPDYVRLARELRELKLRDYSRELGVVPLPLLHGPSDVPKLRLVEAGRYDPATQRQLWEFAKRYMRGEVLDLGAELGTVRNWMLIGPFPSEGRLEGLDVAYPPEESIDLTATYPGVNGPVRWIEYRPDDKRASVDLVKVFQPSEHVCAYALCYVTSPREIRAEIRLGTNDAGKMWFGGKLVYEYPYEGTAILDRDIVEVTIPKGTSPILLKVCNGVHNWGFVLRITDEKGRPIRSLRFHARPE